MEFPWQITPSGHIRFRAPTRSQFQPGAWADVEATLGIGLPSDFKALITDGRAWTLDNELFVLSPFDENPHLNLILAAARSSWAAATLRHGFPDEFPYPLFPEPGGLLLCGVDGNGNEYLWRTDGTPESWPVIVCPARHDGYYPYPYGVVEFIERLRAGEIDDPIFSAEDPWPPAGAAFGPRTP